MEKASRYLVDTGRDRRHDQPHQPVGRMQRLQLERQDARDDRLHEHETEIAPQQPGEDRHQAGFRVRGGAAAIGFMFGNQGGSSTG